jgi:hypothetical protein
VDIKRFKKYSIFEMFKPKLADEMPRTLEKENLGLAIID